MVPREQSKVDCGNLLPNWIAAAIKSRLWELIAKLDNSCYQPTNTAPFPGRCPAAEMHSATDAMDVGLDVRVLVCTLDVLVHEGEIVVDDHVYLEDVDSMHDDVGCY